MLPPILRLPLVAFGLQRLELKELFQLLISLLRAGAAGADLFGGLALGRLGRRLPTNPWLRHHSSEIDSEHGLVSPESATRWLYSDDMMTLSSLRCLKKKDRDESPGSSHMFQVVPQ